MYNRKVTPEIKAFISSNHSLSGSALKALIEKKFNISISSRSVEGYLTKARAEAAANNKAKIEAVREKILNDADRWANKYLQYTDDEIESLRKLIKGAEEAKEPVQLETARDRLAASAALNKMLSTIINFVKPDNDIKISINQDLSKLSDEELEVYGRLAAKLEGLEGGEGKAVSP